MSTYDSVTADLDEAIKILNGIAKDLKNWKPKA